jgi:hypothetical protein
MELKFYENELFYIDLININRYTYNINYKEDEQHLAYKIHK